MAKQALEKIRGGVGLWAHAHEIVAPSASGEIAALAESLGYAAYWLPEAGGREALVSSSLLLAATSELVVGTAIASIWARDAMASINGARTLHDASGGRFVLGLGVSHGPLVENMFGLSYDKPLATMRTYLERMAALPDFIEPGAGRPTRLLAALGPKMIELSGTMADGAHPYLVTPEQTATTREILGPDKWVVSEQAVVVGEDSDEQLRRAHLHLEVYSGLPNYRNSWLRQGFDESDLVRGGSDRLAKRIVGMGSVEHAAASVTAHLDAGADHVVVQVLGDGNPTWDPRPALRELAGVLNL